MAGWRKNKVHGGYMLQFRPEIGGQAKVAELADALDLGSSGVTRESSSLSFRTNLNHFINF